MSGIKFDPLLNRIRQSDEADLSSVESDLATLKNNEVKVTYYSEISSDAGTITLPTGAVILLDEYPGGVDALVSKIIGGEPNGENPVTALGAIVDVTSFDALGNFVLSGVPVSYPVALIYVIKIKSFDWHNLDLDKIIDYYILDVVRFNSPLTPGKVPVAGNGNTLEDSTSADIVAALGFTPEDTTNKAVDISSNDNVHYPTTQAVKTAIDASLVGLLNDRGSYDASSNLFPSTGGSGSLGAIRKGDIWYISVPGTLGGVPVLVGYSARSLVNAPGQISSNWDILNVGLGYVPENVINKDTDVLLSGNSDTKYPSQKATKTYIDVGLALKEDVSNKDTDGTLAANSDTKYASQKATKTYADTKLAKSSNLSDVGSVAASRVNLLIDKRTSVGDADYTILNTDRNVVTSASFTAPHIFTLPLANSVNPGYEIIVYDEFLTVTSVNTLTIVRQGGDTINGATSELMQSAGGMRRFFSDGVSKWGFDAGVVRLSATQTLTNKTLTAPIINGAVTGTAFANLRLGAVSATLDGGGAVLTVNSQANVTIPYAGVITGWEIVENSSTPISSSAVVSVWKDTYANYPPTVADTIFSTNPTLSSAIKNQNLSPTFVGAGATVTANDMLIFNLDSITSAQKLRITIFITKSF